MLRKHSSPLLKRQRTYSSPLLKRQFTVYSLRGKKDRRYTKRNLQRWESLGSSWVSLGASWEDLRAIWKDLRFRWEDLGASKEAGGGSGTDRKRKITERSIGQRSNFQEELWINELMGRRRDRSIYLLKVINWLIDRPKNLIDRHWISLTDWLTDRPTERISYRVDKKMRRLWLKNHREKTAQKNKNNRKTI